MKSGLLSDRSMLSNPARGLHLQHAPSAQAVYPHFFGEPLMFFMGQAFSESVCGLVSGGGVHEGNLPRLQPFAGGNGDAL